MKPFRGKRRGPQSLLVGFNRSSSSAGRRRIRKGRGGRASGRRPVHFRRAERHDRFAGSHKLPGKVADPARFRCYRPGRRWPAGGPRKTTMRGRPRPGCSVRPFELRGLSSVPASRERSAVAGVRGRLGVGGESVGYLSDPS